MAVVEEVEISRVQRNDDVSKEMDRLISEHKIDVYVNENLFMQIICTNSDLEALVAGRLLTEGLIRDRSEIQKIYVCDQGYRARVFLDSDIEKRFDTRSLVVPTCCTDNKSLNVRNSGLTEADIVTPITWKNEWIFALADAFDKDTDIHRHTSGTHSCFLMIDGEILYTCEDIGRHNALDKAVGCAFLDGKDLSRAILYTSGRVPMDMMRKVIRAKSPVIVSKVVPTAEAVEMANEYHVTLIGSARPNYMKVYTSFQAE